MPAPSTLDRLDANYEATYAAIARWAPDGEVRAYGDLTAAHAHHGPPIFNRLFVSHPPDPGHLADAVAWFHQRGQPFQVVTADRALERTQAIADDRDLGLAPTGTVEPGMVLDLQAHDIPDPTTTTAADVRFHPVTTPGETTTWNQVANRAFGLPIPHPDEGDDLIVPPAGLHDDAFTLLLAHVDDEDAPVATGLLHVTDATAGVYTIGVPPEHRRQGLGTAMTWALLQEGVEQGCDLGVLHATEEGLPVYVGMGFVGVEDHHHLGPDPDGGGS